MKRNAIKKNAVAMEGLRTPRSAAIAGMIFAVLITVSILLIGLSMPSDPAQAGSWLGEGAGRTSVAIGVNLIPFAGIAFLWFMGVVRDRLGDREDRFFATVFLGSGLLFVSMLFASAAVAIGMLAAFQGAPSGGTESELWELSRQMTFALLNVFALRMAAVFIISTSTIAIRTSVTHRWLAFLGFAIGLVLLLAASSVPYINLLLPFWIFLVSVNVLVDSWGGKRP